MTGSISQRYIISSTPPPCVCVLNPMWRMSTIKFTPQITLRVRTIIVPLCGCTVHTHTQGGWVLLYFVA